MENHFESSLIFKDASDSFKKNSKYFLLLTLLFTIANFLLGFFIAFVPLNPSVMPLVSLFLFFVLYAKMAIMVHQAILQENNNISDFFRWSSTEMTYLSYLFLIYVCIVAVIYTIVFLLLPIIEVNKAEPSGLFYLLSTVLYVIIAVIFARLSVLFPAIAIGKPITVKTAWATTAGKKGTLFFVVVFFPFFIHRLLNKLPENNLWLELLGIVLSVVLLIYCFAMVSHCYHRLCESADHDIEKQPTSDQHIEEHQNSDQQSN